MSAPNPVVQVRVTPEEKRQLEAQAEAERISVGLLMYRRIFDKPEAERPRGRKPKHGRDQSEGLFQMTG